MWRLARTRIGVSIRSGCPASARSGAGHWGCAGRGGGRHRGRRRVLRATEHQGRLADAVQPREAGPTDPGGELAEVSPTCSGAGPGAGSSKVAQKSLVVPGTRAVERVGGQAEEGGRVVKRNGAGCSSRASALADAVRRGLLAR